MYSCFRIGSPYRSMDASQRGRLMHTLADLILRDTKYIAMLETYNNGKPLTDALSEIWYCAQIIRYYAGWCDKIHGSTIPVGKNSLLNQESRLSIASVLIY